MRKLYDFIGGRKVFYGLVCLALLVYGAKTFEPENYTTFEAGVFAIYASMVLGNVGSKFVLTKNSYGKNEI